MALTDIANAWTPQTCWRDGRARWQSLRRVQQRNSLRTSGWHMGRHRPKEPSCGDATPRLTGLQLSANQAVCPSRGSPVTSKRTREAVTLGEVNFLFQTVLETPGYAQSHVRVQRANGGPQSTFDCPLGPGYRNPDRRLEASCVVLHEYVVLLDNYKNLKPEIVENIGADVTLLEITRQLWRAWPGGCGAAVGKCKAYLYSTPHSQRTARARSGSSARRRARGRANTRSARPRMTAARAHVSLSPHAWCDRGWPSTS